MSTKPTDLIKAILNNNLAEAKSLFKYNMQERVTDKINDTRKQVATSFLKKNGQ